MKTFASADDMKSEIVEKLQIRLKGTANVDADMLSEIVDSAINEIETIRNYPSDYTEDMIQSDMSRFYNNVYELALYDFNQIGAEGETGHTENGITRQYKDRNACLKGVRPISAVI